MKKSLLVILLLLGLSHVTVHATETTSSANIAIDDGVVFALNHQVSESELALLESNQLGVEIGNKPIIKVYNLIYWELSDASIEDIVKQADLLHIIDYVVFDEEPIRLRIIHRDDETLIGNSSGESDVNFINDIQKMNVNTEILGNQCEVLNIYCFDMFHSRDGASVYYVTNKGIFIKYYEDEKSEGVWFTEQEYRDYGIGYYNYISAPENNYNEKGEPLGGSLSFLSYIDNYHNKTNNGVEDAMGYIILAFVLTMVVIFGVVWFVKRKKKQI